MNTPHREVISFPAMSTVMTLRAVAGFCAIVASLLPRAFAADEAPSHKPDWMRGEALNVVLSIENIEAMKQFYGEVLGLESLPTFDLPARKGRPQATIMIRYRLGRTQIKMIPSVGLSRLPGGRATANGLRVLSLPTLSGDAIAKRYQAETSVAVDWTDSSGFKVAWLRDPDDNEIELRWYAEGTDTALLEQVELALTTADVEGTRRYYGEWLSLPELPSAELAGYPGTTYRYRVGESVLRLWSSGTTLPFEVGYTMTGYGLRTVQFIVRDADKLHTHLVEQGATIAQGPTPLGSGAVLLFAADPDGTINECIGPGR